MCSFMYIVYMYSVQCTLYSTHKVFLSLIHTFIHLHTFDMFLSNRRIIYESARTICLYSIACAESACIALYPVAFVMHIEFDYFTREPYPAIWFCDSTIAWKFTTTIVWMHGLHFVIHLTISLIQVVLNIFASWIEFGGNSSMYSMNIEYTSINSLVNKMEQATTTIAPTIKMKLKTFEIFWFKFSLSCLCVNSLCIIVYSIEWWWRTL